MKIKEVHLEQFKRFTDLTIQGIPYTAKLIVLMGPNGCGKSSLFDAFKAWYRLNAYSHATDDKYCKKDVFDARRAYELVNITFHEDTSNISKDAKKSYFYFRTAYRNSPSITVNTIHKIPSPLEVPDDKKMIDNDSSVDDNYLRLMEQTLHKLFDIQNDNRKVVDIREEILGKVRESMSRLFPELLLEGIGVPTDKAEFYFEKGTSKKYEYEKLSGGEKAAFDLLLDLVVKSDFYKNTVFCIDEPETHIHTQLQAQLLREMFNLVGDNSQLWIATHSFGMMKEAQRLFRENPGQVVFLNFDGYDFDETVILEPSECDSAIWHKMLEISLDDYAALLSPKTIVFCEGNTAGRKRQDFDARCYTNIFKNKYPDTMFYSLGSCNDVEKDKNAVIDFVHSLSPNAKIIRVIDRDDRSDEEVNELKEKGVRVLSQRNLEGYLLDLDVLLKWSNSVGKFNLNEEIENIRTKRINQSVERGNPSDDLKSAANDICTDLRKRLQLTKCGNTAEMIMRDTISKLITEDMEMYKKLENDIFGE